MNGTYNNILRERLLFLKVLLLVVSDIELV